MALLLLLHATIHTKNTTTSVWDSQTSDHPELETNVRSCGNIMVFLLKVEIPSSPVGVHIEAARNFVSK